MSPLSRLVSAVALALVAGCDSMALVEPAPVDLTARAEAAPARPLILVDGRRLPPGYDLRRLSREDIVGIEVIKSSIAATVYGPEALRGVIAITTRNAR
ncbi:MAG: TonB-dependent receptor [Gemmatimonadales bacterium]